MEQFDRIKQARDQRLHKENEDIRHNDLITQSIQTQETILRAFSSFVDYLDNRVGKTEVVNQLKTIGTPDALKVVEALNSLHETLKTHENTDLTEVTSIMQAVLDEAKLIPKTLPEEKEQQFIDYSHFFYTDCVELGSGVAQDYMFTTTSKYTHLSFEIEGSAITALDVYEASDKTGTTLQTIFNNNRISANTSLNTIRKGTSGGTTDGTKIWCYKSGSSTGSASRTGASSAQDSEIILKLNTKYIFRVTSGSSANLTNIKLGWYEK